MDRTRPVGRLAGVYLAVLLLVAAAWQIGEERHWALVFLRYAPPLVWFCPFLLLLAAGQLLRRPVPRLLSVAILAVLLGWFLPLEVHTGRSGSLKVLSYNIHAGLGGPEALANFLQSQGADLVILQEARRPQRGGADPMEAIARAMAGYAWARGGSRGELVILSRFPISESGELQPQGGFRPFLEARIELPQGPLLVINVHYVTGQGGEHLTGSRDPRQYLLRTAEVRARQTGAVCERLRAWEGPVLVAGDFNSTPLSFPHRRLSQPLQDGFEQAGLGFGQSFPARAPLWRIDYCLASRDFQVTRSEVLACKLSDHLPLWTELNLRRNAPLPPE